MTPGEIRLGGPLFNSESDQLIPYLIRRRDVLQEKLKGLLTAEESDEPLITQVRDDIAFYESRIK
jgi:tRNA (adenine22-N1)-methyltransferase